MHLFLSYVPECQLGFLGWTQPGLNSRVWFSSMCLSSGTRRLPRSCSHGSSRNRRSSPDTHAHFKPLFLLCPLTSCQPKQVNIIKPKVKKQKSTLPKAMGKQYNYRGVKIHGSVVQSIIGNNSLNNNNKIPRTLYIVKVTRLTLNFFFFFCE